MIYTLLAICDFRYEQPWFAFYMRHNYSSGLGIIVGNGHHGGNIEEEEVTGSINLFSSAKRQTSPSLLSKTYAQREQLLSSIMSSFFSILLYIIIINYRVKLPEVYVLPGVLKDFFTGRAWVPSHIFFPRKGIVYFKMV